MQAAQRLLSTRGGTIAVSAVAAALAAVILVAYLHRYRDSVRNSGVPVTVLVAKGLIEKGTSGDIIASQDLYQVSTLPKGEVTEGAITDPATLKGRVTTTDVFPGEQLTAANVETGGSTSLANRITGDERAVTIPIDAAHGMAGNISAGDHVDIYAGFTSRSSRLTAHPTRLPRSAPSSSSSSRTFSSSKPRTKARPASGPVGPKLSSPCGWATRMPRRPPSQRTTASSGQSFGRRSMRTRRAQRSSRSRPSSSAFPPWPSSGR